MGPAGWGGRRAAAECWCYATKHPVFSVYTALSVSLAFLLIIDPLFNKPNGLITTSIFTGRSSTHGSEPCSFDYEGSWAIGTMSGSSPLSATISSNSVLSCASVANLTAASYLAEPYLVIPPNETEGETALPRWYAFYQVKNVVAGKGEIGVAMSVDRGASWQHIGTALKESFSISSPWVAWDRNTSQYVMIPDTHKSRDDAVQIYVTSKESFPFGWRRLRTALTGDHFLDTTALEHNGRWWMFTTVRSGRAGWLWGYEPSYTLRLFSSASLLGNWVEHPRSPISTDLRYARSGGRPFLLDGVLHRWAQDDSDFFGESLHLFKATMLDEKEYLESFVMSMEPSGNGNWYTARTHHIDIQLVGTGSKASANSSDSSVDAAGSKEEQQWFGLVDGDRYRDGTYHFYYHERSFVRFKTGLLRLDILQFAITLAVFGIWHFSDRLLAPCMARSRCRNSKPGVEVPLSWWERWHAAAALAVRRAAPEICLALLLVLAGLITYTGYLLAPQTFYCPRWNVVIDVLSAPPVKHIDNTAPYNVSDLVVVTGATESFFDRITNMVGSVHVWEPEQKIIVYDLGFSQSQLAQMMCWENVEVRQFPYEQYPPHVRDVRNYAFKTITLMEAMKQHEAVLWIDSGLELRAPMDTMRRELAQHGHVSALQEDLIGDPMYTLTKNQVDFFGLSDKWDEIQNWQFCAGGLQGFVRNSDADRLVLQPVVNCSLHEYECIAPPGASRLNHNFDQTALTIMIWQNNFSCLPRETHCMWSVKKASRDPLQLSAPIEVISRGHRLPKPYSSHIRKRKACVPDKARVPWPVSQWAMRESTSRHGLLFKITRVYMQPVGDFFVMGGACVGAHLVSLGVYVLLLGLVGAGFLGPIGAVLRATWTNSRPRLMLHMTLGMLVAMLLHLGILYVLSRVR